MGFLILVAVIVLVVFLIKRKKKRDRFDEFVETYTPSTAPVKPIVEHLYSVRPSVFTRSETAFFMELKSQLPAGYYVFPKMRIADMLQTPNGSGYYKRVYKIIPKHIDFLICNAYFKPVLAIELNGNSHWREKTRESDQLKREIFESVGMPLKTVEVGESFAGAISDILSTIGRG